MTRSISFGTAVHATIRVDDPYVSPLHCQVIETGPGRFEVEDLGSTNGTFLVLWPGHEERVYGRTLIGMFDRIRIGRTMLPWYGR